jgi:RND family efflux transporter MFP subunit
MAKAFSRIGLPAIAAILFGITIATIIGQPSRSQAPPVLPVAAAPFASRIAGLGVIEPQSETIAVGTHIAGIVSLVQVKVGDRVTRGQPLFTIDDRAARAALASAEAEIKVAEAAAADARAQLAFYERVTDRRAVAEDEVTARRFASRQAEARLDRARAAAAEVATEIERLTVKAPIDGRILKIDVRPGEFAPTGVLAKPLMAMGDDRVLHVRVEIDESQAWRLKPGARAVGSVRGAPEKQVPLSFVRIEPRAVEKRQLTGGSERVDTRVIEAIYAFEPAALGAFIGQQMDVFIEAAPLDLPKDDRVGASS